MVVGKSHETFRLNGKQSPDCGFATDFRSRIGHSVNISSGLCVHHAILGYSHPGTARPLFRFHFVSVKSDGIDDDGFRIRPASRHCFAGLGLGYIQPAVWAVFAVAVRIAKRDVKALFPCDCRSDLGSHGRKHIRPEALLNSSRIVFDKTDDRAVR